MTKDSTEFFMSKRDTFRDNPLLTILYKCIESIDIHLIMKNVFNRLTDMPCKTQKSYYVIYKIKNNNASSLQSQKEPK